MLEYLSGIKAVKEVGAVKWCEYLEVETWRREKGMRCGIERDHEHCRDGIPRLRQYSGPFDGEMKWYWTPIDGALALRVYDTERREVLVLYEDGHQERRNWDGKLLSDVYFLPLVVAMPYYYRMGNSVLRVEKD